MEEKREEEKTDISLCGWRTNECLERDGKRRNEGVRGEGGRRGEAHKAMGHGGWTDSICSRLAVALVMDGEPARPRRKRWRNTGKEREKTSNFLSFFGCSLVKTVCVSVDSKRGLTDRWTNKRGKVTKRHVSQRGKST